MVVVAGRLRRSLATRRTALQLGAVLVVEFLDEVSTELRTFFDLMRIVFHLVCHGGDALEPVFDFMEERVTPDRVSPTLHWRVVRYDDRIPGRRHLTASGL